MDLPVPFFDRNPAGRKRAETNIYKASKHYLVVRDQIVLEVREARMVLKNVGIDRAIKIGGGRDGQMRSQREHKREEQSERAAAPSGEGSIEEGEEGQAPAGGDKPQEGRGDKKRERRRKYRGRRGRDGGEDEQEGHVLPGNGQQVREAGRSEVRLDQRILIPVVAHDEPCKQRTELVGQGLRPVDQRPPVAVGNRGHDPARSPALDGR